MRKKNIMFGDLACRLILLLYSFIVIFPVIWTIGTSLKTNGEFFRSVWSLPKVVQWNNYSRAIADGNLGSSFVNSVIIASISLAFALFFAATTAYITTRLKFKGRNIIISYFNIGLFVPGVITIIPLFFLLNSMHLLDKRLALIVSYVAFFIPFSVYVLQGFYKSLPHEIEESAMIDGCSFNRMFWVIIFPLAKAGLVTISIFDFIGFWNEYIFGVTFITDEAKMTLAVAIVRLMEMQRFRADWVALFAGLVIIMLPILIVYMVFQSRLVDGLTEGAVKG